LDRLLHPRAGADQPRAWEGAFDRGYGFRQFAIMFATQRDQLSLEVLQGTEYFTRIGQASH
jgi:hypothetical protein